MPGVYFFAASALITMLAYGWANTVPPRPHIAAPRVEAASTAGEIVTLPSNPARRHRPLSKDARFGSPVADPEPL
jgi:paraquat-inducible protein A